MAAMVDVRPVLYAASLLALSWFGLFNCTWARLSNQTDVPSFPALASFETAQSVTGERRVRSILSDLWKKITRNDDETSGGWTLSREEAARLFEEYYECLKRRVEEGQALQMGKLMPVHAIILLDGESVTMECLVCVRPDQDKLSQVAVWQHARRSDSSFGPVAPDDKRVTITVKSALFIKEVRVEDAGQYTCLDHGEFASVYQLDVLLKENRKMVRLGDALLEDEYLPSHNLVVRTVWSPWGGCDTCDAMGQRKRRGVCMVKKLYPHLPIKPNDLPLITLFPEGLPCRSTAIPVQLRFLKAIRHRLEETLVDDCSEPCPTTPPPVIKNDTDGQPLELLESEVRLAIPPLPKAVERHVLYEPEGKHLVLQCSEQSQQDVAIRWLRGRRRLDPLTIRRRTKGRVWVDGGSRLHIKRLMLSDTDVYSCWERMRHLVAIKVLVINAMNQRIKEYITYGGLIFTVLGSFVACCCVLRSKSKKTAR